MHMNPCCSALGCCRYIVAIETARKFAVNVSFYFQLLIIQMQLFYSVVVLSRRPVVALVLVLSLHSGDQQLKRPNICGER